MTQLSQRKLTYPQNELIIKLHIGSLRKLCSENIKNFPNIKYNPIEI